MTPRTWLWTIALVVGAIGLSSATWGFAPARIDAKKLESLKAAYIRHLAEYTQWPKRAFADDQAPILVGTLGGAGGGVAETLMRATAAGNITAQNRPLKVRRIQYAPPAEGEAATEETRQQRQRFAAQLRAMHLIYVEESLRHLWPDIRSVLGPQPVLTISDAADFTNMGGMIGFVLGPRAEGQTGLDMNINLVAVEESDLKLSSKLLSLRQAVRIVAQREEE